MVPQTKNELQLEQGSKVNVFCGGAPSDIVWAGNVASAAAQSAKSGNNTLLIETIKVAHENQSNCIV